MRSRTTGLPDVWGLNYEFDALEAGRDAARLRTAIVTECSNEPATFRGNLDAQIRQVRTIEADLARLAGRPWAAGFALWSFNDYATVRKGRQYRHCGVVDAWRQPKAAWAYLQARHAREPCLRVWCADWEERAPAPGVVDGGPRTVCVLTNCETVQVRINGRAVGGATGVTGCLCVLRVPFEAGELEVAGWRGGQCVVDGCRSWSAATAIAMEPACGVLRVRPGETAALGVRVVDAAGRTAAHWSGLLTVRAEGAVRARGFTPRDELQVAMGIGRAFIQAGHAAGRSRVTVRGAGLEPAGVEVEIAGGDVSDVS